LCCTMAGLSGVQLVHAACMVYFTMWYRTVCAHWLDPQKINSATMERGQRGRGRGRGRGGRGSSSSKGSSGGRDNRPKGGGRGGGGSGPQGGSLYHAAATVLDKVFRKEGLPKPLCQRSLFAGKKQVPTPLHTHTLHPPHARASTRLHGSGACLCAVTPVRAITCSLATIQYQLCTRWSWCQHVGVYSSTRTTVCPWPGHMVPMCVRKGRSFQHNHPASAELCAHGRGCRVQALLQLGWDDSTAQRCPSVGEAPHGAVVQGCATIAYGRTASTPIQML
jgi:hypothetical protein